MHYPEIRKKMNNIFRTKVLTHEAEDWKQEKHTKEHGEKRRHQKKEERKQRKKMENI